MEDNREPKSLEELIQLILEQSMVNAMETIEELGIDMWLSDEVPMSIERKCSIMEKMMDWFEEREQYERCALLRDALKEGRSKCKELN